MKCTLIFHYAVPGGPPGIETTEQVQFNTLKKALVCITARLLVGQKPLRIQIVF